MCGCRGGSVSRQVSAASSAPLGASTFAANGIEGFATMVASLQFSATSHMAARLALRSEGPTSSQPSVTRCMASICACKAKASSCIEANWCCNKACSVSGKPSANWRRPTPPPPSGNKFAGRSSSGPCAKRHRAPCRHAEFRMKSAQSSERYKSGRAWSSSSPCAKVQANPRSQRPFAKNLHNFVLANAACASNEPIAKELMGSRGAMAAVRPRGLAERHIAKGSCA
mmetsp:Transcript_35267/g.101878  ORF Transcript_35267/g.101878 Transcript_35267/m.101878 type:complete len:227 (+) Transcript_35267:72-752(+)